MGQTTQEPGFEGASDHNQLIDWAPLERVKHHDVGLWLVLCFGDQK